MDSKVNILMNTPTTSTTGNSVKKGLWWKILLSILLLGTLGMLFSRYPAQHGSGWYHQLKQPFFAPPYWLPFVLWTIVYILMGSSLGILWHNAVKTVDPKTKKLAKQGILLFFVHLIFNLSSPIILMGLQMPGLALMDMLILTGFIIYMIYFYKRIAVLASRLLVPYLLWIIYATALNAALLVLN